MSRLESNKQLRSLYESVIQATSGEVVDESLRTRGLDWLANKFDANDVLMKSIKDAVKQSVEKEQKDLLDKQILSTMP